MSSGKDWLGRGWVELRTSVLIIAWLLLIASAGGAFAQAPPPVDPPTLRGLPDGRDTLSLGQWLLYPTLSLTTLYNSNLYGSPTTPVKAAGFDIHPSLNAVYDTGIWQTSLYGNIDSTIYPTLDPLNDTFNRQAGFIERYEAMRDLVFTAQGNYSHNTLASVFTQSIPGPVISPASPGPQGANGVVAVQQTVVNPNDIYTATGTMHKDFNRADVTITASSQRTNYENQPLQDFNLNSYTANGGFWITPQFYAYGVDAEAFQTPVAGLSSSSYLARVGIGSARIGLFSGSIYVGHQGSAVVTAGTAGGYVYGGALSYFPTEVWDVSVSFDETINISNITSGVTTQLANVPLSSSAIPTNASVRVSSTAFHSDYQWSAQTSVFGVMAYTQISYIGSPRIDNTWLATVGVGHRLTDQLSLSLNYQYSATVSNQPGVTFTANYVTLGANYNF